MILNSSNASKLGEFVRMFAGFGVTLQTSSIPIKEIDASPIEVIVHKVSAFAVGTIVDDTILNIEGVQGFGIHTKRDLPTIPQYIGCRFHWVVRLAMKKNTEQIFIYEGQLNGLIVSPRGDRTFGFDCYVQPDGCDHTLGESKPDKFNPRYLAVKQLIDDKPSLVCVPILDWQGPWQTES